MARGNAKTKVSFCNECRREYLLDSFYKTKNPFHKNGVTLYCKDCCEEIVQYYLKQTGTLETAMWFACSQIGVPFIRKAYDEFEKRIQTFKDKSGKEDSEYNLFANYYTCLTKNESKVDNWNDFSATDVALGDIQSLRKSEIAIEKEFEDLRFIWGKDKTVEQLQYLEFQWKKYTEDKDLTDYQESLYRDLCIAELDIYENNETDNALKRKMNIGAKLGLDKFEIDKEKTLLERTLEAQIAVMEQNEPAFYYKDLEKYADFMGIGNYWQNHVIRPIKNMLLGQKEYKIIEDKKDGNNK